MLRWLERFAAVFVLLLTVGVLLACWAPAYVGAGTAEERRGWRQRDRMFFNRGPGGPAGNPAARPPRPGR